MTLFVLRLSPCYILFVDELSFEFSYRCFASVFALSALFGCCSSFAIASPPYASMHLHLSSAVSMSHCLHTYVSKLSRYVQVSRPLRLHCSRCRLRRTRLLSFSHATRALPLPIDRRFRRCCASAFTVYIYLRTRSLCACIASLLATDAQLQAFLFSASSLCCPICTIL